MTYLGLPLQAHQPALLLRLATSPLPLFWAAGELADSGISSSGGFGGCAGVRHSRWAASELADSGISSSGGFGGCAGVRHSGQQVSWLTVVSAALVDLVETTKEAV